MTPRTRTAHRPKFRVGQVVRVMGSEKFRTFLPDYFRICRVKPYGRTWEYRVNDHKFVGPWVASKQLRALTKRERGA